MAAEAGGATWYSVVEGEGLLQGDALEKCPVLLPPPADDLLAGKATVSGKVLEYDVIVVTHSCDLLQKQLETVLVCPLLTLDEISQEKPNFAHKKMQEHMRQGHNPGYHMLHTSTVEGLERPIRVADFHTIYSLPADFVKRIAVNNGKRLRLDSPYREDFSQAFARFFMRVALPIEIPELG